MNEILDGPITRRIHVHRLLVCPRALPSNRPAYTLRRVELIIDLAASSAQSESPLVICRLAVFEPPLPSDLYR